MHRYIIKRILLIIPVVFFVSFIIFWLLDFAPGDAAYVMATEDMTDEEIDILREEMGKYNQEKVKAFDIEVVKSKMLKIYSSLWEK